MLDANVITMTALIGLLLILSVADIITLNAFFNVSCG